MKPNEKFVKASWNAGVYNQSKRVGKRHPAWHLYVQTYLMLKLVIDDLAFALRRAIVLCIKLGLLYGAAQVIVEASTSSEEIYMFRLWTTID